MIKEILRYLLYVFELFPALLFLLPFCFMLFGTTIGALEFEARLVSFIGRETDMLLMSSISGEFPNLGKSPLHSVFGDSPVSSNDVELIYKN